MTSAVLLLAVMVCVAYAGAVAGYFLRWWTEARQPPRPVTPHRRGGRHGTRRPTPPYRLVAHDDTRILTHRGGGA